MITILIIIYGMLFKKQKMKHGECFVTIVMERKAFSSIL